MKPGGGKAKGAQFEREICKRLSLWVSNGRHEDLFWRSSLSGGRATVAHRKGKKVRQSGDLTAVAPEGHIFTDYWYVECKHVKKLNLDSFLIRNKGELAKFWAVAKREAAKHERRPMVIARQNGWPILVIVQHRGLVYSGTPLLSMHDNDVDIHDFEELMDTWYTLDKPDSPDTGL